MVRVSPSVGQAAFATRYCTEFYSNVSFMQFSNLSFLTQFNVDHRPNLQSSCLTHVSITRYGKVPFIMSDFSLYKMCIYIRLVVEHLTNVSFIFIRKR